MTDAPFNRPLPDEIVTESEFMRWYWTADELAAFARRFGVRAAGQKTDLEARVAAALGGRPGPPEQGTKRHCGPQLTGQLTEATLVPVGQRCSQHVRAWLAEQVGPSFRFDAVMRRFFAEADGTTTLGDAVHLWRSSRDGAKGEIGEQFELNRFTRAWHQQHPDGDRSQLLAAWRAYRNRPIDERGRV